MFRPGGRKGDDDLGPVIDRISRVQSRTVTTSSRGAFGSSTKPPPIPIRSRPPLPSYLPHTLVPYDVYGSSHPSSHLPPAITHDYTTTDYVVSSSKPFIGRDSGDMGLEGDRGLGEEPNRIRSLHIGGDGDERVHDDGDDDHDDDDGDDAGDEEQPVPLALVAPGLSPLADLVTEKGNGPAEGGPVDPELIPSYGGYVAGPWFIEVPIALHDTYRSCGSLLFTDQLIADVQSNLGLAFTGGAVRPGTQSCKPNIQQFPISQAISPSKPND
ncbi:hypothetical protein M9H77_27014 [Catharanthus roseus]|uniref:Uncharacterized protein n=1 Tax=Catharanthus roseus TaxID=4058 RepID=A0ACC0ACB4_CATRO|nr:hypothetical protein M9H77_27014 [Catharanthus roseus]